MGCSIIFCLFTMRIWINDIIIDCRCQDEVDLVGSRFSIQFKMYDRGGTSWFLQMQIKQSPGTVKMNQTNNIDNCLERLSLAKCKSVGTPDDISVQFSKKYCPEAGSAAAVSLKDEYYRGIVGSLLWGKHQKRFSCERSSVA